MLSESDRRGAPRMPKAVSFGAPMTAERACPGPLGSCAHGEGLVKGLANMFTSGELREVLKNWLGTRASAP